jgi:hypothetical protein
MTDVTRQGVRDLNQTKPNWVDPTSGVVHRQHARWLYAAACGLNIATTGLYHPLRPRPVTCLACLAGDP